MHDNVLCENDGDGTFTDVTSTALVATGGNVAVWGDFNDDGSVHSRVAAEHFEHFSYRDTCEVHYDLQ